MNILIVNTAAEHSGALKVLEVVYKEILDYKEDNFYLMVGKPELESKVNLTVLRYPEVKSSLFKRLYCDTIEIAKLIKKYDIDMVISLQNTLLYNSRNTYNVLYLQQSLQYLDVKCSPFNSTKDLWYRKNIIGRLINHSAKSVDKIYVQTEWIGNRITADIGCDIDKVKVVEPNVYIDTKKHNHIPSDKYRIFFYPAGGSAYKNHMVVLEAAKKLKKDGIDDFEIVLTVNPNDAYGAELKEYADKNGLPVKFTGIMPYEDVLKMYETSVLVFASEIETFGFPLKEMAVMGGPIIVSDRPYARDVLKNYTRKIIVKHKDTDAFKEAMKKMITGDFCFEDKPYKHEFKSLIKEVTDDFKQKRKTI